MKRFSRLLFIFSVFAVAPAMLSAQTLSAQTPPERAANTFAAERERAIQLANADNFAEALPLLERLAADKQADAQIFLGIGIAYWKTQISAAKSKSETKERRLKAREAFLKAKELGVSIPDVDLILSSIRADGGDKNDSDNPQAQAALDEAFQYFAARDYQKAAVAYERAATLDPTHYEAALYTGNTFYALKDYDKAGVWFAKAIALDPNREVAYRYWGDGFMNSGRNKEAQDKFFDAIVAEPYSSTAWRGLMQFAQRENIKLAHPKIDVPVNVSTAENGNTNITLGIDSLKNDDNDDGSFAWTVYGLSRAGWRTGKDGKLSADFAKAYPNEKIYRHSLAEEASALRTVLTVLNENKKVKKLNPSLALLKKLNDEGLLEAYILIARSDAGIQRDYAAYRQNNRDKLKRYLAEYVVKNGGN